MRIDLEKIAKFELKINPVKKDILIIKLKDDRRLPAGTNLRGRFGNGYVSVDMAAGEVKKLQDDPNVLSYEYANSPKPK